MTTTLSASSSPIGEAPALGLGRDQSQAWVRLALTIATTLRQHRLTHGRAAFSDQHTALRRAAQYANDLDPRVAAMAAADETAFRHSAVADNAAAAGFEELTSPDPQFGWTVHTTIGPIPAHAPSGGRGRWGLWAHGRRGDTELSVFVVVPDLDLATALRDEVTHGHQRTLTQLRDLGVYGRLRADDARTQLRPDDTQFTEHVRHALHTAWPDHPDLATQVLHPNNDDAPRDRALEGLHQRLRALDERGYRPVDILATINPAGIDRDNPRAALTTALDTLATDTHRQPSAATSDPAHSLPRRGTDLHAAVQLLRHHLDPDTTAAVTGCRHWPGLARQLHTWHHNDIHARYLATELARVPAPRVRTARAPAIYLRSILDRNITFRRRHDTAAGDAAAGQNTNDATTEEQTPGREQVPPTPFDIHRLDPSNALDREALRASRGVGGPTADDHIDAILAADHPTEIQHPDYTVGAPTQERHTEYIPDQQEPENVAGQMTSPGDMAADESPDATRTAAATTTKTIDSAAEAATAQPAPTRPARFTRKRQNTHTPRQHH
ncbi:hypothetical protein [Pseudonocardia sp. ICBG1293]|uniref:hypothetical protein n=1 Tax=Pseudonocardia sp. ICBG1293 TaxID=2844382 RepID=UPI001CC8F41B|nr:hypothetical protein [Pseudonocardia sp. ICBG1293]